MSKPWRPIRIRTWLKFKLLRKTQPSIHVLIADHLPAKTLYWAVVRATQITDPTAQPSDLTAADLMTRTWEDRRDVGIIRTVIRAPASEPHKEST